MENHLRKHDLIPLRYQLLTCLVMVLVALLLIRFVQHAAARASTSPRLTSLKSQSKKKYRYNSVRKASSCMMRGAWRKPCSVME